MAVLLVLGAVTPVMAISPAETDAGPPLENTKTEKLFDGSPALQKTWARVILGNLSQSAPGDYRTAHDRLNQSMAYVTGPARVSDARAFTLDATAVSSISLNGDERQTQLALVASRLVVSADNETVASRIDHARWALTRTEDDLPTGVERSASAHLQNAERAYERGQRTLDSAEGSPKARLETRADAIRQFRVAWIQATKALDAIDAATSPEVTVTTRGDPPRNGTAATTGQIRGTVFDVRPHDLTNVTVTVGGNRTVTAPLEVADRANATFAVNVTLRERITEVNVTVGENESTLVTESDDTDGDERATASGSTERASGTRRNTDSSDTGNAESGAGGAPSGKQKHDQPDIGSDVVLFDGDGVPDTYEVDVLGMDPQDPDSDSSKTAADESADSVIDGLEDFDDDNVTNFHEGKFGADPFAADADGDGLPDEFEVQYPPLDPRDADSDSDGVRDDEWDVDADGLTNAEEYAAGSNPLIADADRDDLDDGRELEVGTAPSDPDTDGDGLLDGEELHLDTDPLSADSDGDGVADGNTTFTTETTNASLGVNVSLTGQGDVAGGVTIENGSLERFDREPIASAQVTPFVNLESERDFESANVTFSYDEAALDGTNESDLVVFRYNESLGTFEPLTTTVDASNDTVTGRTEHFSRFVAFDVRNWASNFVAERPEDGSDGGEIQPLDVVFIIDTSGSMSWNDPQEFRKQAAKEFVGALLDEDRAGVVDFDSNAHVAQELTTDHGAVNVTIESLDAWGGTDIGDGVARANYHFADASNDSRAKTAILLTDGVGSGGRAEARTAAERNTTIYTIGFGGANGNKLADIAQITGGNYTHVDSASDLPEVFSRVAEDIGAQDTDGDGLADVVERRGVPTGDGLMHTDPYDADTDGDGLADREELGEPTDVDEVLNDPASATPLQYQQSRTLVRTLGAAGYNLSDMATGVYVSPNSLPTETDSDGDGLDDYMETHTTTSVVRTTTVAQTRQVVASFDADDNAGSTNDLTEAFVSTNVSSDPMRSDSDFDRLDDGREWEISTNPTNADTDGDAVRDAAELDGEGDPTLYDAAGPTIEVRNSGYHVPSTSLDTTYWVRVRLADPAGVERAAMVKAGSERTAESYGGERTVYDTLEFTETFAGSDSAVDTSSVTSTFISFGGKVKDTTASVGESVGDAVAGSTVYVESEDVNDNANRVIGVQRASFYGDVAGSLYTGTILDYGVARSFGQLTGLAASFGVFVQDISQLIDDPYAVVEGLQALVALLNEQGLAAVETIVQTYARQVEQTQARNNPYGTLDEKEHPELYDTFRKNWYEGYAAGFLAKLVMGAAAWKGAKETIKGTSTFASVSSKLEGTRALRLLQHVKYAKNRLKARATARLVLKVDDAAGPFVRNADTAGEAFYRWRMVRQIDADVDDLPESNKDNLGRLLARTGEEGVDVVEGTSQRTTRVMTDGGTDVDSRFRTAIVRASRSDTVASYGELDEVVRHIDSLPDAAQGPAKRFIAASDAQGVKAVMRFKKNSNADLGPFVRKIDRLNPDDKRSVARMVGEAEDGAALGAELSAFQLQRIADQDAGRSAARINDRGVDVSKIERLVNEGVDLNRVDTLLANEYGGWSTRGTGLSRHYEKHVVEDGDFGGEGSITKNQYDRKARNTLNDRNGEVYYQTDNNNLAVYDPTDNSYVVGNANGRIQTLFQPTRGRTYVDNRVSDGKNIRIK